MSNTNKIEIPIEAIIDKSSLSNAKKKLAKEKLAINMELSFENAINSKKESKRQISLLKKEIKSQLGKGFADGEVHQLAKQYYDSVISETKQVVKQLEQEQKQLTSIQLSIDTGKYSTEFAKIENQLNSYGTLNSKIFDDAKKSAGELSTAYNQLNNAMNDSNLTDSDKIKLEEQYQKTLAKTQNLLEQVNSVKDNEIVNLGDDRRIHMIQTLNDYLAQNTAMSGQNKQTIQEWVAVLSSSDDMTLGAIKNINTQFQTLDSRLQTAKDLELSWSDKLKQAWEKLGSWGLVPDILNTVGSKFSEAISELKELDTILTGINQTSNLTKQQLKALGDSAFETASEYGKSAGDYLIVVKEMYDAGFDNAEQMSQLSILAQAAGGLDSSTANEYLIASNAAYDLKGNVEELNEILDGQSYIAKNATVSMQNMALATSEAASTASQYGVQVDELSALIATAVSITRESGSEVGNALNAIFANLQDTASAPIQEAFDAVNISMIEMSNGFKTLKTPIELLTELSSAFAGLNEGDSRREDILSNIGGEEYADTLSALLSNWSSYEQLLGLYSQGMGTAAKEAENTANSWEGSLNRLSNTWTDTIGNIANSDAIITGINALNGLLGFINSLTEALGSLGSIGLGAGLFAGIKNVGRAKMFALI